jgi:hypothetical protein
MLKKASRLTRPTLAGISPTRPESAKTASSPRDAPSPKQGRSERRSEEVQTALRVGRSPLRWVLANEEAPTVVPTSEKLLLTVEGLSDARTLPGKKRVSARRGWVGEMSDFFSIRLELVERLILQDSERFRCV